MFRTALSLGLVAFSFGCASAQPPRELIDARSAYNRAASGTAAQMNPAQLHVAQQSLQSAEKTFEDDGDSIETRDRAYIAGRRAEIAEVQGRVMTIERQLAQSQKNATTRNAQELQSTKQELATQEQRAAAERARRMEAEKRAEQALSELGRIGSIKREERGMVVTIPGNVLFASGKAELLGPAQAKLSQVAEALTRVDKDSRITVLGHTDSQGSDSFNQTLSQNRAESVRAFLVSHGMASDRVEARGMGESQPVADNNTAEGRANNRRVEIVVEPPSANGSTGGPSTTQSTGTTPSR